MNIREFMKARGFKVFRSACGHRRRGGDYVGSQRRPANAACGGRFARGRRFPSDKNDKKQVPVVLTPARQMTFESRIVVSGSVHAERYALVSARIRAPSTKSSWTRGDGVRAGETKLFQTDALKLTKAVAISRQDLAVAQASVQEKQALLAKDLAARTQALNDVKRYRELLKRNAVAAQVAEQQETELQQCDADVRHTQALIDLAAAQLEQARLNLTIAERIWATRWWWPRSTVGFRSVCASLARWPPREPRSCGSRISPF